MASAKGFQQPIQSTRLSPWDQAAPRFYMTVVLCFRVTYDGNRVSISKHIQDALTRLARKRPDFAGGVACDPESDSSICFQTSLPNPIIPFAHTPADLKLNLSFSELEKQEFPAATFVNPAFIIRGDISPGAKPLPVVQIRLMYIEGGLLLFVYMHHSYGDGSCFSHFLNLLSSEMRCDPFSSEMADTRVNTVFDLSSEMEESGHQNFELLLRDCPEYTALPNPVGPTQPALATVGFDTASYRKSMLGKIFVIDGTKVGLVLKWLRDASGGKYISAFLAIRALVWAHTTRARMASEAPASTLFAKLQPNFFNPHNWNDPDKRLFAGNDSLSKYFGNGVAIASATLECPSVLTEACDWISAKEQGKTPAALLEIIRTIDEANRAIDQGFVLKRTSLFESAPDIRHVGFIHDARAPHTFSCNTWKSLGREANFWFPGERPDGVRPSAIRRVQGEWAFPHGLVLPARPDIEGGDFELLVTLSAAAMNILVRDEGWMSLVNRVVE